MAACEQTVHVSLEIAAAFGIKMQNAIFLVVKLPLKAWLLMFILYSLIKVNI
jgi:hypothetical protein